MPRGGVREYLKKEGGDLRYMDQERIRAEALAEYPIRVISAVSLGWADLVSRALALVGADSHQAG